MRATSILVRTLSVPAATGPSGDMWQYHSQSDRHSKVACWGILLDLLETSATLRAHMVSGKVTFGVNHSMADWSNDKEKKLDLVLCRPADNTTSTDRTFRSYGEKWGVQLSADDRRALNAMPDPHETPVGAVLVALEAKACMTAHVKALPRLFDELNSSHQIVHGASSQALSVGYVMVNFAPEFISSKKNQGLPPEARSAVSPHTQPHAAVRTVEAIRRLRRRSGANEVGYDGIGIVLIHMQNDGSPVRQIDEPPAPGADDVYRYENMITRVANEYDATFRRI